MANSCSRFARRGLFNSRSTLTESATSFISSVVSTPTAFSDDGQSIRVSKSFSDAQACESVSPSQQPHDAGNALANGGRASRIVAIGLGHFRVECQHGCQRDCDGHAVRQATLRRKGIGNRMRRSGFRDIDCLARQMRSSAHRVASGGRG